VQFIAKKYLWERRSKSKKINKNEKTKLRFCSNFLLLKYRDFFIWKWNWKFRNHFCRWSIVRSNYKTTSKYFQNKKPYTSFNTKLIKMYLIGFWRYFIIQMLRNREICEIQSNFRLLKENVFNLCRKDMVLFLEIFRSGFCNWIERMLILRTVVDFL
jgi:hypothetical protein